MVSPWKLLSFAMHSELSTKCIKKTTLVVLHDGDARLVCQFYNAYQCMLEECKFMHRRICLQEGGGKFSMETEHCH
jgi:hypothetical protein